MIDEKRLDDDDASDVGVPTMPLFFHLYGSTRLCPCADNAVIFPSSSAHRSNE